MKAVLLCLNYAYWLEHLCFSQVWDWRCFCIKVQKTGFNWTKAYSQGQYWKDNQYCPGNSESQSVWARLTGNSPCNATDTDNWALIKRIGVKAPQYQLIPTYKLDFFWTKQFEIWDCPYSGINYTLLVQTHKINHMYKQDKQKHVKLIRKRKFKNSSRKNREDFLALVNGNLPGCWKWKESKLDLRIPTWSLISQQLCPTC